MPFEFQLLTVESAAGHLTAVVSGPDLFGRGVTTQLATEFDHLSHAEVALVTLDLQGVVHIEGAFVGQLLDLHRALAKRGSRLEIRVSNDLRQVLKITRMDRVLTIVS
jgi:anti-anti-sigma regulatory factor